MKIKTKILFMLLGVGLVPAMVFGFWNIYNAQQALQNEILRHLWDLAELKEGHVFVYLDLIESRAGSFASDGFIRSKTAEIAARKFGASGSERFVDELNRHLIANKMPVDATIAGILVMDTEGVVIAATDSREIGKDDSGDEYVAKGLTGVSSADLRGEVHFGNSDFLVASAPILDRVAGSTLGVVAIFFKTEKLSDIISGEFQLQKGALTGRDGTNKTQEIYLVDGARRALVRPPGLVGRGASGFATTINTEPVEECLARRREMLSVYDNYDGKKVLGASRCFADKNWTLLSEIDAEEAFAVLARMRALLLVTSILFLAFVVVFSLFFGGRIIGPIQRLREGSEIIGGGNLDYRLNLKTGDELEQLGNALNRMAERLQGEILDFQKFKMAIDHSSDHVVITDPDAHIVYANPAAERLTGYSFSEMAGKRPSLWGTQMGKEFYAKMWQTIKTDKLPFRGEIRNKRKTGLPYIADVSILPLLDESGSVLFFVGVERDITEAKLLERARDDFFAIASHELRTPLTAIRGNMALLKEFFGSALKPEALEMIDDSYNAALRLIGIVNDFLDASRLEQGKVEFKKETVDLAVLFRETARELAELAKSKKLFLEIAGVDGEFFVIADRNRTKQIVYNLLSNAIQYTQQGGVSVAFKKADGFAQAFVIDTGDGISSANRPLLFRKFQQAGEKILTRDATKSTGLGLYISKLMVEEMGGKIWLERSELDRGSAFAFALPFAG